MEDPSLTELGPVRDGPFRLRQHDLAAGKIETGRQHLREKVGHLLRRKIDHTDDLFPQQFFFTV